MAMEATGPMKIPARTVTDAVTGRVRPGRSVQSVLDQAAEAMVAENRRRVEAGLPDAFDQIEFNA